jgi:MFS family permease
MGIGLFVLTLVAFVRSPLIPEIGRDLQMSAFGLGLLGSVFAVGRLAADFPAGRLTDRFPPGPMMGLSAAIVMVGSFVLGTATGPAVAAVAMFVLGVGSTSVLTTAMAHFAKAPRVRRGVAMSVFAGSLLAGQSFGPTVGGALGERFGWRTAIVSVAVLAGLAAVMFLFVRGKTTARESVDAGQKSQARDSAGKLAFAFIYLLPAVQFSIGGAILQTLVPIVADGELGMGVGTVGLALGVGGLCRLVSSLVAGQITDRVSRRWAMLPGQVLQTAGLAVFALWGSRLGWMAAIVLVTLGSVGVNVGATVLADLSEGERLGNRLGAFRFTGDAAFMVAPALSGLLYQHYGRFVATTPLLALSLVVTVGVWVFVPETRH